MGLSDEYQESVFRWLNGAPLYYDFWRPGEPRGYNVENCVSASLETPMVDVTCSRERPYTLCSTIGEIDLNLCFVRKSLLDDKPKPQPCWCTHFKSKCVKWVHFKLHCVKCSHFIAFQREVREKDRPLPGTVFLWLVLEKTPM